MGRLEAGFLLAVLQFQTGGLDEITLAICVP